MGSLAAKMDPFLEVNTDAEFDAMVVKLCKEGYQNTEVTMDISISYVLFACGETNCMIYSPKHKMFTIMENGKRELPGFHTCPGAI